MKAPVKNKPTFWVVNVSPMNVTLADLAINIKAYSIVNLLDDKHYSFYLEQLVRSQTSGSIFKKRDKIRVRKIPPPVKEKEALPFLQDVPLPSHERSTFSIKETHYEELNVNGADQHKLDEQLASENAELDLPEADKTAPVKKS
jgi:hypothetical protein